MKCGLLILLLFFTSNTYCFKKLSEDKEKQLFNEHLVKYKIRSARNTFSPEQFNTFISNFYDVEDNNELYKAGKSTFQKELNEFSHIPYDEFISHHTGYIPPPKRQVDEEDVPAVPENNTVSRSRRNVVPLSYDWRNFNAVPPVKNQGSCGSCWAFAAVDVIESRMMMRSIQETLSVQEIINCPYSNSYTPTCNGGWGFVAYKHAMKNDGVTKESIYPYTETASNYCNPTNYERTNGSNIKNYYATNYFNPTNEETIKYWLYTQGPLYATYHVASDFGQYKTGVYTDPNGLCRNKDNNHAILLVGYGNENGVDYWLAKNSWGDQWGDQGFFKIQRGVNLCGIARDISYVIY